MNWVRRKERRGGEIQGEGVTVWGVVRYGRRAYNESWKKLRESFITGEETEMKEEER